MTLSLRRIVGDLEEMPSGYGIAFLLDTHRAAVCYPMPLNWLVGWARNTRVLLVRGPADPVTSAFSRGLDKGREIERGVTKALVDEAYGRGQVEGLSQAIECITGKRPLPAARRAS